MSKLLLAGAAIVLVLVPTAVTERHIDDPIAAAIAHPDRLPSDLARDADRQPTGRRPMDKAGQSRSAGDGRSRWLCLGVGSRTGTLG